MAPPSLWMAAYGRSLLNTTLWAVVSVLILLRKAPVRISNPPAFVVIVFPSCPTLVEEGLALKVAVELFAYFRSDILQRKADEVLHLPFQLLGYV